MGVPKMVEEDLQAVGAMRVNSLSCSGHNTVSKVDTKKIEPYTSKPCEHPRVTDATAHDTLDFKIA